MKFKNSTKNTHKRTIQIKKSVGIKSQRFLVVLYFFTDSIMPSARPAMP